MPLVLSVLFVLYISFIIAIGFRKLFIFQSPTTFVLLRTIHTYNVLAAIIQVVYNITDSGFLEPNRFYLLVEGKRYDSELPAACSLSFLCAW